MEEPARVSEKVLEEYDAQNTSSNLETASRFLAEHLSLQGYRTDAQSAAKVDFIMSLIRFSKESGFTYAQTCSICDIGLEMLQLAKGECGIEAAEISFKKALLRLARDQPKGSVDAASPGCLSVTGVEQTAQFFIRTFFQHFRLYRFLMTQEQPSQPNSASLQVETALVQPFSLAMNEEQWQAYCEDKAAQALQAAEDAAAAKAAEEASLLEAAAAAEEQAKKLAEAAIPKVPQTLEEAVSWAVAAAMKEEKARLEAEYGAKQQPLLDRLAQLDAKLTPPPKKK